MSTGGERAPRFSTEKESSILLGKTPSPKTVGATKTNPSPSLKNGRGYQTSTLRAFFQNLDTSLSCIGSLEFDSMLAPLTLDFRLSTLDLELRIHAGGFCSNALKTGRALHS
jgi:hypothetical protein